MRHLPFLVAVGFALLPYDAQVWAISVLRSVPPDVWVGVGAATLTGMFWYSAGWAGLAQQQREKAHEKAEAEYRRDKGWM